MPDRGSGHRHSRLAASTLQFVPFANIARTPIDTNDKIVNVTSRFDGPTNHTSPLRRSSMSCLVKSYSHSNDYKSPESPRLDHGLLQTDND